MKRRWIGIVCILAIACMPLVAQLLIGFEAVGGVPVHDTLSDLNSTIQRALIVAKQVAQLALTVDHIAWTVKHYNFYTGQMAGLGGMSRWGVPMVLWRPTGTYSDTYGRNVGWLATLNKDASAVAAYLAYVDRMETQIRYGGVGGLGGLDRMQRQISSLELEDSANSRMLGVLGDYRSNQQRTQFALDDLRGSALGDIDPTEKAVLQKINATNIFQAQATQNQNELLASKMEMDLATATANRNAMVRSMNDQLYVLDNAPAALTSQASGTTSAIRAMSLP